MMPLRPSEIVQALDRHIVGQQRAKRAIAVAIRNRWRNQQAHVFETDALAAHRYVIAGPRGVGKTQTVRRAASSIDAPFVRVSILQLAAAAGVARATGQVFESLVDCARQQPGTGDLEAAIQEAETAGMVLIDGLDRWLHSGGDILDDPLETAQQALYGLAAAGYVDTRYGAMQTHDIMMFVAGDLTALRPAELPVDLQSLFPKRIELDSLDQGDLLEILLNPASSPLHDFAALLRTEGLQLHFTHDGIKAIAVEAGELNHRIEDIGARRLGEIIEIVLDDLLFDDVPATRPDVTIDAAYVAERIAADKEEEDLDDFIL